MFTHRQLVTLKAAKAAFAAGAHTFAFYGGSGSGKTYLAASIFLSRVLSPHAGETLHLAARSNVTDLLGTVWDDTIPHVLSNEFDPTGGLTTAFKGIRRSMPFPHLQWGNGARVQLKGVSEGEKRRDSALGSNAITLWIEECTQLTRSDFDRLTSRVRQRKKGFNALTIITFNPPTRTHWLYDYCETDPPQGLFVATLQPQDNYDNLDKAYRDRLEGLRGADRTKFLVGDWGGAAEGALWKPEHFQILPAITEPLLRTVISVDPATTYGEGSDETGIIVAAQGESGKLYVLADHTQRTPPTQWAAQVRRLVSQHNASLVAIEANQGGKAWRAILGELPCNIKEMTATSSKMVRAEPIAGLYADGQVCHVAGLDKLQNELLSYNGRGKSPNRMDALVWAISSLKNIAARSFKFVRLR